MGLTAQVETRAREVLELSARVEQQDSEILELSRANADLTERNGKLRRQAAEGIVRSYIEDGRLLPKGRRQAVEILLSDRPGDLEAFLAPDSDPAIVMLSQRGVTGLGDGELAQEFDIDAETTRLANQANEMRRRSG